MSMWKYKNVLKVALDYIKTPYHLLEPTIYSEDAHEHICFARRLMGSSYKDVCPYRDIIDINGPERSDCCDMCKYFGIIDFYKDMYDQNNIRLIMHASIVDIFTR